MHRVALKTISGCATALLLSRVAVAGSYRFGPMSGSHWAAPAGVKSASTGGSYTAYTGLADSSAQLYLMDTDPVARDDVVVFDGVEEQIDDYLNIPGLPLVGQRRFVTESTTNNGDGSTTDTFRIRCVSATGAPADLWPGGLAFNGIPLPNGGVGLGLGLPAELGGSHSVAMQPDSVITKLTIEVLSNGSSSGQIDLPVDVFISPKPTNWSGQLGIILFSAADAGAMESQLTLRLTSIPEPSTLTLLACLTILPLCTRRRAGPRLP